MTDIDIPHYKQRIAELEAARWEFKKALAKCYGIAVALHFEESPDHKNAIERIAKVTDEALNNNKESS